MVTHIEVSTRSIRVLTLDRIIPEFLRKVKRVFELPHFAYEKQLIRVRV